MGRHKKLKIQQQVFGNKEQLRDDCKFEDFNNPDFSSPVAIKTRNVSVLETTATYRKTKRIFKPMHQISSNTIPEKLKIEDSFIKKDQVNEINDSEQGEQLDKNVDVKRPLTLSVNDDIRTYYQLIDVIQSLDALIIKYYKDPLLSSILMDTNMDEKLPDRKPQKETMQYERQPLVQKISNVKIEQNINWCQSEDEKVQVKFQQNILQQSSIYQSEPEIIKQQQQYHKSFGKENSKQGSLVKIQEIEANLCLSKQIPQPTEQKVRIYEENQSIGQISYVKIQNSSEYEEFLNDDPEFDVNQPQLSNLNRWLSQVAVFVDKFSASEFRKLFKLKQTLNSILSSVNKSIKKQLDTFSLQLKGKQKKEKSNEGIRSPSKQGKKEEGQEKIGINKKKQGNKEESMDEDLHVCRICWQYFENGHQLGGHMSKKHPGHSLQYRNKQLIKTRKVIERERRLYFRMIQGSVMQRKPRKNSINKRGKGIKNVKLEK